MALFNNWLDYGVGGCLCAGALWFFYHVARILLKLLNKAVDGQIKPTPSTKPVGSNSDLHKALRDPKKSTDGDSAALRFHRRELSVTDHYFFSTVDGLVSLKITSLKCGCDGRTALLRTILSTYLSHWRDALRAFCASEAKREDFDSGNINNPVTLEARLNDVMVDTTKAISIEWVRVGVPDAASGIFTDWSSKLTDILVANSRRVASSPYFSTNRERLISLLSAHTIALEYTLNDARVILRLMNGRLDGVIFDGYTIQPLKPGSETGTGVTEIGTDPPFDVTQSTHVYRVKTPVPGRNPTIH